MTNEPNTLSTEDALLAKASTLAQAIRAVEDHEGEVEAAETDLYKTDAYMRAVSNRQDLADAKAEASKIEDELRDMLREIYEETGDKSPLDGLGIRVYTKTDIRYDPADATEWAKKNAPAMLIADPKAFEPFAQTAADRGDPLPFVTIETNERVTPTISKSKIKDYGERDAPPF